MSLGRNLSILGFMGIAAIVGYHVGNEVEKQRQESKFRRISIEAYDLMEEDRGKNPFNKCVRLQTSALHLITDRSADLIDIPTSLNEEKLRQEVGQYLADVLNEVEIVAKDYHKSQSIENYCNR